MNLKTNQMSCGYSIFEALACIGVFSILLLASASFFSQTNKNLQNREYRTARIRLFHSLINVMGMPSTLRASGAADPMGVLGQCINHTNQSHCGGWPTQPPIGVALHLPPITGTTVATLSGPLSGSPTNPLLFSAEGKTCDPAKNQCPADQYPITVTTKVLPICPPAYSAVHNPDWSQPIYPAGLAPMGDCWQSLYIKVYYEFRPTPGAADIYHFEPVTGTIMVSSVMAGLSI